MEQPRFPRPPILALLVVLLALVAAASTAFDNDGDGKIDSQDNCPRVSNPGQTDGNADGIGDACTPQVELCDGIDNDLDGTVDEGLTPRACVMGQVPGTAYCLAGAWVCAK